MSEHTRLFIIEREIAKLESLEITPDIEKRIAQLDEEANLLQASINEHRDEIERLQQAKQAAYEQKEIENKRREAIRVEEYQERVKNFFKQHCISEKISMLMEEFGHEFEADYEIIGTTVKSHVAQSRQDNIHFCGTEEKAISTLRRLMYWRIRDKLLNCASLEDIYRIEDILDRIGNTQKDTSTQ